MPLIAEAVYVTRPQQTVAQRLVLAIAAIAVIGVVFYLATQVIGSAGPRPAAPSPFSVGVRETASTGIIGGFILNIQARFYLSMMAALRQIRTDSSTGLPLLLLGFGYGVFHAAGPGHGKGVIASFLLADQPAIRTGILLCTAAALMQALVAIGIVGIFAVLLHMTAAAVSRSTGMIELASFVAISGYGLWLTWTKTVGVQWGHQGHAASDHAGCLRCSHGLMSVAPAMQRPPTIAGLLGVILAAGMRPCSGAVIILAFALSQDMFLAGVLAVLAMAAGTACTTLACATTAAFAKRLARRLVNSPAGNAACVMAVLETGVGAAVFWLGIVLISGWRPL